MNDWKQKMKDAAEPAEFPTQETDSSARVADARKAYLDAIRGARPAVDVEGFEAGGTFHPIRGSEGYKRTRGGDPRRKPRR